MIRNKDKYLYFMLLRLLSLYALLLFFCFTATAQTQPANKDSSYEKRLFYYHSVTSAKKIYPYTKIDYSLPNNQLMSWPDFPLTPTEIERRHRVAEKERKPASIIAKDIITNLLKKKTKVAVIPKF